MDPTGLLPALKTHARIDGSDEDANLILMLVAAANDVAQAASYELPEDVMDLPADLQFAIIDLAVRTYDARGADDLRPGLSMAAGRITARYRGVSLGLNEAEA